MKKELLKNKLSEVKADVSEDEWNDLSSVLKRRMFFKFHAHSFNIYYLVTGLALLGIYSYILLNINHRNGDLRQVKQIDTIYIRDTVYLKKSTESDDSKNVVPSISKHKNSQIHSDQQIKHPVSIQPGYISIKDTVNHTDIKVHLKTDSSETSKSIPKKKNKRIKYVTVRDTIYQVDTAFTGKRRK